MAKTITVTITEDAQIEVSLHGYQGKGCSAIADALTSDCEVTKVEKKPEFHRMATQTQTITTKVGR